MVMIGPDSPVLYHADTDGRLVAARHGSNGHPVQRQVVHLCPEAWSIFVGEAVRKQRELRTYGLSPWEQVRSLGARRQGMTVAQMAILMSLGAACSGETYI